MGASGLFSRAPFADVERIGLPRALLYYRYGVLWQTFFETLGKSIIVSAPTDRRIVERGDALANDESCLAGKIYLGHVESLLEACDAVFVPSVANVGHFRSFCTRFQSLPDLVANTFSDQRLLVLSCLVDETETKPKRGMRESLFDVTEALGISSRMAKPAWKSASRAHEDALRAASTAQNEQLARITAARKKLERGTDRADRAGDAGSSGPGNSGAATRDEPIAVLFAAHPYLSHDPFVGGVIVGILESLGAVVLRADETDRKKALQKSFEFSQTLPWIINRELIGSIMLLHRQIDGIVLASAFPCGPDSMTDDAVMRCIEGTPILNLTVDAQSGTAGLETRIESFVDILRYQKKGGYVRGL